MLLLQVILLVLLPQVYRIKQITRSTFNDVLMTAMSGSLRSFFKRRGVVNPPDIKTLASQGFTRVTMAGSE
ncbi:hypothetical protein MTO96_045149 [Rhipicephalus appendiculatus]